jgi:hypothetical protein
MTGKAEIPRGDQTMKIFLLLAVSTVVTAGVLPSLPAKIILIAFVLLAALIEGLRRGGKHRKRKAQFIFEQ